MKTVSTNLMTLIAVVITLNANAQNRNGGGPRQPEVNTNTDPNGGRYNQGNNTNHQRNGYYSGGFYFNYNNGGSSYYNNNYNNYYNNNPYNLKRAARMTIQRSAQVIGDAVYSSNWNDTYSPWLAKAIRHQQYAKQLYFYGDYAGALNHSERASFLAISTLNYFNNDGYGYTNGGGNYPNPYSDPNNPYYRQGTTNTQPTDGMDNYEQGNSQRKTSGNTTQPTVDMSNDIDSKLPQEKMTDRELLKVNAKDLSVE